MLTHANMNQKYKKPLKKSNISGKQNDLPPTGRIGGFKQY